jgi:hypothetical protein
VNFNLSFRLNSNFCPCALFKKLLLFAAVFCLPELSVYAQSIHCPAIPKVNPLALTGVSECGMTTFDLTNLEAQNFPSGTQLEWQRISRFPISSTKVFDSKAVGSGTYYLYAKTIGNVACYSPASDPVVITINPILYQPYNQTITPNRICAGERTVLSGTCDLGVIEWATDRDFTQILDSNIIRPTQNITLFSRCTKDGCVGPMVSSFFRVNNLPMAPQIIPNNTEVCLGQSITLKFLEAVGTITLLENGEPRNISGNSTVVTPTVPTQYSAFQTLSSGCISPRSQETNLNYSNSGSAFMAASTQFACPSTNVTLKANGCTGSILWYRNGSSAPFASGATVTFAPTAATTIRASCAGQPLTTCGSGEINSVDSIFIDYQPSIAAPIVRSTVTGICRGGSVNVRATGCPVNYDYLWSDGGKGSSRQLSPTSTTTYGVKCQSTLTSCSSPNQNITIQVASTPTFVPTNVISAPTLVCKGASSTLSADVCSNGTLKWFDDEGLWNELPSNVVSPTETTLYYASCVIGDCKGPAQGVYVEVREPYTPDLLAYFAWSNENVFSVNLNGTVNPLPRGQVFEWYSSSIPNASTLVANPSAVPLGQYYVRSSTLQGNCKSSLEGPVSAKYYFNRPPICAPIVIKRN